MAVVSTVVKSDGGQVAGGELRPRGVRAGDRAAGCPPSVLNTKGGRDLVKPGLRVRGRHLHASDGRGAAAQFITVGDTGAPTTRDRAAAFTETMQTELGVTAY